MIVFLSFVILASIVVFFSMKLAKTAEVIEINSNINAAIIGILIAIATSLPEFATGITSLFLGEPQMATGNVLGSNLFNFLILAFFNILYFKTNIFKSMKKNLNSTIVFILLMYINFLISAVIIRQSLIFSRFEIGSLIILIIYFIAIKTIRVDQEEEKIEKSDNKELQKYAINFIFYAFIILVASILLAKNADQIIEITGLQASVVGAIFIGIATSLPELITSYTLIRQGNYTMSASSVLSSNLFNFTIVAILDILSSEALYVKMDTALNIYIYVGIVFCIIYIIQISCKKLNVYASTFLSLGMISLYIAMFIVII